MSEEYWKDRAQRAEAECERLRNVITAAAGTFRSVDLPQHAEWLDFSIATPPPEGNPSGVKESLTAPEQAHGDALAALDSAITDCAGLSLNKEEWDKVRKLYVIARNALTASGVPEVVGEAAFLAERLREFEEFIANDEQAREWHSHVAPSIALLEQALAAAPTDGREND